MRRTLRSGIRDPRRWALRGVICLAACGAGCAALVDARFDEAKPVSAPACGDGSVEPGEGCDDGNLVDADGCEADCTLPSCGNGVLDPGEECDDGNVVDEDDCEADCTLPSCGNGLLDSGEGCDDGNLVDADGCEADCTLPSCGNGVLDPGEACDDGNAVDGDGCDVVCTPSCGNGVVDSNEACDDANASSGDGCEPDCSCGLAGETKICLTGPTMLCYGSASFGSVSSNWGALAIADIDGEHGVDILAGSGKKVALFLNDDGCGRTALVQLVPLEADATAITTGDFDGDGDVDVAVSMASNQVRVLRNDGGAAPLAKIGMVETNLGPGPDLFFVTAGDVTGDGRPDLAVVNATPPQLNLLDNDGNGGFVAREVPLPLGDRPVKVRIADLDGDGDGDIVVACAWDNSVWVFDNLGAGELGAPTVYPTSKDPNGLVLVDLDGDGYQDIVTAGWDGGAVSVLMNLGASNPGAFAAAVDYFDGNAFDSVLAADVDGDGHVDVVALRRWTNEVALWRNAGDGSLAAMPGALLVSGAPQAIAADDLNQDGRADIVEVGAGGLTVLLSAK